MQLGARRSLHAVIGPQVLRAAGSFDGGLSSVLERLLAVGGSEGDVAVGVPVLGEEYMVEFPGDGVDAGDDDVAIADFESPTDAVEGRQEVALHVDDEKSVGRAELHAASLTPRKHICADSDVFLIPHFKLTNK